MRKARGEPWEPERGKDKNASGITNWWSQQDKKGKKMEENKSEKTIKVKLHGYKKCLKKVKRLKKEMKELSKITRDLVELKRFNGEPTTEIFFLCDGEVPDCTKTSCHEKEDDGCQLTSDINHAKNFVKRECGHRTVFYEKDNSTGTP